ncbi:MAG: glycine-rich protein [Bacilli bacterium]|nr:glycine-rich protein [Bacilli bacterium]
MKKGFTIVELLMVIVLIGLLSTLIIPNINKLIKNSGTTLSEAQIKSVEDAAEMYAVDYQDTFEELDEFTIELKLLKDLAYVSYDIKDISTGKYYSDNSLITFRKENGIFKATFYPEYDTEYESDIKYSKHMVIIKGDNIYANSEAIDPDNIILIGINGAIYDSNQYNVEITSASSTNNDGYETVSYTVTIIEDTVTYIYEIVRDEYDEASTVGPTFTISDIQNINKSELTIKVNIISEGDGISGSAYSFDNGVTWQSSNSKVVTTSFNNTIKVKDTNNHVASENHSISKLTINANGGIWNGLETSSYYWIKQDTTKSIINPIKLGYTFTNWSVTTGTGTITGGIFTMGSTDTTITANWAVNSYKLTLDLNGGTTSGETEIEVEYGASIVLTEPTKEDYLFNGWIIIFGEQSEINVNTFTMGCENAEVQATWELDDHILVVDSNGGEWVGTTPQNLSYGQIVTINNPTKIGYSFVRWDIVGEGSSIDNTSFTMGTKGTTLTAVWDPNPYTLTVNSNGGTWSGTTPQTILYGSTITIEDPTRTSYSFLGWTISGSGSSINGTTFTMGYANTTITANWVLTVQSFAYTGGIQSFTVAATGTYKLEVWGARGGGSGALGGYSYGYKSLTQGTALYIVVGGTTSGVSGGYNGGGSTPSGAYGGGGATHIATATGVLSSLTSNRTAVIIVAGGGGGISACCAGGTGGGTNGGNSSGTSYWTAKYASGGTQTSGGYNVVLGSAYGSFGQGSASTGANGGGGGGGWYGGGGGTWGTENSGGGGGSGYIGGVTSGSMTNGSRSGNGYATITFIE